MEFTEDLHYNLFTRRKEFISLCLISFLSKLQPIHQRHIVCGTLYLIDHYAKIMQSYCKESNYILTYCLGQSFTFRYFLFRSLRPLGQANHLSRYYQTYS